VSPGLTDYRLPFDEELLLALNGLQWDWLDAVWVGASTRVFGVSMAVLFGLWLLATLRWKAVRPVLQAAIATGAADQLGNLLLKPLFHRMRPHFALPGTARHFAEAVATGPAMPSLHAACAFAFVTALGLAIPRSLPITLPVATLIAISRVGVGVHWPSDVYGGAIFGALVGLAFHHLFKRFWPT
jgi:membrane-associated phospholipid phosphatase